MAHQEGFPTRRLHLEWLRPAWDVHTLWAAPRAPGRAGGRLAGGWLMLRLSELTQAPSVPGAPSPHVATRSPTHPQSLLRQPRRGPLGPSQRQKPTSSAQTHRPWLKHRRAPQNKHWEPRNVVTSTHTGTPSSPPLLPPLLPTYGFWGLLGLLGRGTLFPHPSAQGTAHRAPQPSARLQQSLFVRLQVPGATSQEPGASRGAGRG